MNGNASWMMDSGKSGLSFGKTEAWPGAFSAGTGVIRFESTGRKDCLAIIDSPMRRVG